MGRGTLGIAAAALMTLAGGCGDPHDPVDMAKVVEPPPRFIEARDLLVQFYGLTETPDVYWYGRVGLDCHEGRAFTTAEGWCVQGITYFYRESILSNYWPSQSGLVGDGAMQHEFAHIAAYQHGILAGDPDHDSHWFQPGGELDQAYDLLVANGLATPGL